MRIKKIIILFFFCFVITAVHAQNDKANLSKSSLLDSNVTVKADTVIAPKDTTQLLTDSILKKKHDPAKATRRSAIIPGWGQAYNHEYWKIPIVYGALAIPAVTFIYNNKWYHRTRDAYTIVINQETENYDKIDPRLKSLINYPEDLQYYRNSFRKDRDYSVLFFLIAWGVNVVDATVFGHLKEFDVTDDLSMQINPGYNPASKTAGVGLAFNFKTKQQKLLPSF